MDEVRVIGYCTECDNEIIGDDEDIYIDNEGRYFCSVECVLEFYNISKVER